MSGYSDWTRVEVSGTAPPGAAYVRVEARLDGAGTLWADDVVVREVGAGASPAPPPTPTPRPAPTFAPTPRAMATPRPQATPSPAAGDGTCSGRYHVSPSGSDANAGTAAIPFRTIQRAANVAWPGDTV